MTLAGAAPAAGAVGDATVAAASGTGDTGSGGDGGGGGDAAAPTAAAAAPAAASPTVVRGGALSRVLAAAASRAAGLRRRVGRATATAAATKSTTPSTSAATAATVVAGSEEPEAGVNGTACVADDKDARDGNGAKSGGKDDKKEGDKKEEDKSEDKKEGDAEKGDEDKEDDEKEEPKVSALGALRVAAPWVVPRTHTLRALFVLAVAAEVARNACRFAKPLLLRYAMNSLMFAAGGAADSAAVTSRDTTDGASSAAAPSWVPAAVTERLLHLLPGRLVPTAAYQRPLIAIVGYICTDYISGLLRNVQRLSWNAAEAALLRDLQTATFAHLHSLSLRWHLNRNSSRVLYLFYIGIRSVTELLELVSFEILPMVAQLIMNLTALWQLGSWRLAALAAGAIGVYAAFTWVGTRLQMRQRKQSFKADARDSSRAIDSLMNYENVKVFATEAVEVRRYRALLGRQNARRGRSYATSELLSNGQSLIQSLFVAAGMVMVGRWVMDGTLSVADFVAAQTFLGRIFDPFSYAAYSVRQFHSSMLSLRKLVDIRQERPDVVDAPDATPLVLCPTPTSRGGRVCFEGVSFAYGADSAGALHDISFTVPAGGTTAIVGPTGSGKSTLLRLLLRLFDVSAGRITIDGQDVAHVTQQSLRDAIGVVPQDCHLLRDSVRTNIAYGRGGGDDVPDADVAAAARVAQLTDWVGRLPKGLASICGERGVLLSGGERQRVGIARMVVRSPAVVVLDESSSSLDSETERSLQSALRDASAGATTLVVAHRLSTVVGADEILVLHAGRIVERGTHDALRRIEGGRYRRMWELQHGGAGGGDGGDEPTAARDLSDAARLDAAPAATAANANATTTTDRTTDGGSAAADGADGEGVAGGGVVPAAAGEAAAANGRLPAGDAAAPAVLAAAAPVDAANDEGGSATAAAPPSAIADDTAGAAGTPSPPAVTVGG